MSDIFLRKTQDRSGFARHVLKKFKDSFSEKKVLVKPNIVSYESYPTTTHPDVVRNVLEILEGYGCEIIVADGPAQNAGDIERIVENHPINRVCKDFGLRLLNLHKFEFRNVKTDFGFSIKISVLPYQVDYIISLPVLKTHPNTDLTGALKNQFGLLCAKDRHNPSKDLHQVIAAINKEIKVDLFIVDGIETYRNANEERWGGVRVYLGYMLAGKDPVALDSCGLWLLKGIDAGLNNKKLMDIEHIVYAEKLGVGSSEYKTLKI